MANRFLALMLEDSDDDITTVVTSGKKQSEKKMKESFVGLDTLEGNQVAVYVTPDGQRIFRSLLDMKMSGCLATNKKSSKSRNVSIDYPDQQDKEQEMKKAVAACLATLQKKILNFETFLNSDDMCAIGCNFHDASELVKKHQRNVFSRLTHLFQVKADQNLKKKGLVFFVNVKIEELEPGTLTHVVNLGFYKK